jgi:hypothetical protein
MDPLSAILNAPGGWVVFIAGMAVVGGLVIKGMLVPRFIYDREVERSDRSAKDLAKNTEALDRLTDEVRWGNRGNAPR